MTLCMYVRVHLFGVDRNLLHYRLDIDECTTGDHNCKSNERCINKHGWFNCKCVSGFTSVDNTCEGIMYNSCSYINMQLDTYILYCA